MKKHILVGLMILSMTTLSACAFKTISDERPVIEEDTVEEEDIVEEEDTVTEETSEETSELTTPGKQEGTVANNVNLAFSNALANGETDIQVIADEIIKSPVFDQIGMGTMEVSEGYLNGFTEEIKGFDKAVMFSPMIGTMPFVGYIFETSNPEELSKTLTDTADLRWNICTEADEILVNSIDNYLICVMAPFSFEEE